MTKEKARELLLAYLPKGSTVYLVQTNHGGRRPRYAVLALVVEPDKFTPTIKNISNLFALVTGRKWQGTKGNESSVNWNGQETVWPVMCLANELYGDERLLKCQLL